MSTNIILNAKPNQYAEDLVTYHWSYENIIFHHLHSPLNSFYNDATNNQQRRDKDTKKNTHKHKMKWDCLFFHHSVVFHSSWLLLMFMHVDEKRPLILFISFCMCTVLFILMDFVFGFVVRFFFFYFRFYFVFVVYAFLIFLVGS